MKKILLLILCPVFMLTAQHNDEKSFSKSYAFEYNSEYGKAIAALQEINPDNYQVNLRLGWLYYLNKDYIRSETHYKKAVSQEPTSIEARFGLVLPMSALSNWNNVLNVYIEILKLDPNNSIANYRTATIYFNRKDYVNSAAYISKVIKMYPFDYDSNLLYGKILLAQNKTAEAKKHFEKALQYNPQSEEASNALKKL